MTDDGSLIMSAWLTRADGEDERSEAFAERARPLYEPVHRFLWRQVGSKEEAADLTQETFIRGYRGFVRFDPERAFAPWIFTIARRVLIDFYRRSGTVPVHQKIQGTELDEGPSPRAQIESADERADLWRVAQQLPPKMHQVLLLHYGEDFGVAQTAEVMGLTRTHVKVLLFRARHALRNALEQAGGEFVT